jgi:hypothetical protein
MVETTVVEKIKTHNLCSITFSENCTVCEIMWKKYGEARQAADGDITRRRKGAIYLRNNGGKNADTHP